MRARRFGIVIIGLALLAAVARLGWRAGLGDDRRRAPARSLPVEDYAPAPAPARQRLALPKQPAPDPDRRRPALPNAAAPEAPPAAHEAPVPAETPRASDGVTRARVRSEVQKAFETKLPSYKLSEADYEQLTDDIMTIREAREKMNALPLTPENAGEHQRFRDQISKAVGDFQNVADMSLSEFTEAVQPEEGITREEPDSR